MGRNDRLVFAKVCFWLVSVLVQVRRLQTHAINGTTIAVLYIITVCSGKRHELLLNVFASVCRRQRKRNRHQF